MIAKCSCHISVIALPSILVNSFYWIFLDTSAILFLTRDKREWNISCPLSSKLRFIA